MNWKWIILLLVTLEHAYRLFLNVVEHRSAGNPTPANVADVYDAETYQRWKGYSAEKSRLSIVSTAVSFVVLVAMLVTDAYAAFAALLPQGTFWQLLWVLLLYTLVSTVINTGLNYVDTMIIEQKYGFNRSTMKTFVTDQIRNFIIQLLLDVALCGILAAVYIALGDWVILLMAGVVFAITMIISFLYPYLSRIGNKFVPLEEGELKEKLMGLMEKHGYQVRAIEVMDASRRTTKLNAYFTGFGKLKTIVLYDNLVNAMTTDEICAVFAHEMGHGIHKDVLKQQTMNVVNMLLMGLMIWLAVREPQMHTAFGFTEVNYGFANILLNTFLGLLQPLTGMVMNAYSRFAEYRADRQAVLEGYGSALIEGLKKLAKENFAHLAPSKLQVVLEYSHPPLSQRIEAVEKATQK